MKSKVFIALFFAFIFCFSSASAKTTITWWQFWTDPDIKPVIESMVSDFEKANPDIKVELTDLTWANGHEKIAIAFGSSTGPDIVELGSDWIAEFASNGLLKDVSSEIAPDSSQLQGWGMSTYQGKVYAQPWILGTRVLFGNRDLLNKAGYDPDWVPVKWNELMYAAKKINRLGKNYYGWGSNTAEKHRLYKKFLPFFWSNDAQIFSDDGKYCLIASDKAVYALTFYKQLNDSCGYVDTQRGIEDAFLNGKIGFILSGDWLLKRIEKEHRKINLMATLMPGQKFPGKSFLGGEFLAINAASKNADAAQKFIKYMTSPENQVKFCKANRSANPSSLKAQQDPYFKSNVILQAFIKQIALAKHPPVDPDWVYIEEAIEGAVEDALFGDGLVAQPLFEAKEKIDKIKHTE
ncbi:MAG TPA: extracellular solute-binding protein [candidate division Zixibacteria bacterium]|nr:extracellular solute-binding protein [candidate division Zixibacteria bacterium]